MKARISDCSDQTQKFGRKNRIVAKPAISYAKVVSRRKRRSA